MRVSRRARVIALAVLLASLVLVAAPSEPALAAPFPCDAAHDGAEWTDEFNVTYQCMWVEGFGWGWHVKPPGSETRGVTYNQWPGNAVVQEARLHPAQGGSWGSAAVFSFFPLYSTWNRPPGSIQARLIFSKWNGSGYSTCWDSGAFYNNVTFWGMGLSYNHGLAPPCGAGWYITNSFSFVHDGNAWRGSPWGFPSGAVWVPGFGAFTMASPTKAPPAGARAPVPPVPTGPPASSGEVANQKLPPGLEMTYPGTK
jgi:hypothetical protein